MKGFFSVFALLVLVLTVLEAGGAKDGMGEDESVKIGYLGALTGNLGNYGTLQSQAVELAYDDFKAQYPEARIGLVIEDTAARSDRASQAVEKMLTVDKIVALIGPVTSGVAMAVTPRLQQAGIVTISASATAEGVTAVGNYIFRTVGNDAVQANVLARYVYNNLGLRTVGILFTENDYSEPLAMGFKDVYEARGGEVVAMESSLEGDKDFKTQLTKLSQEQPAAIFLPNYAVELAQILRQASQLGIESQFISADGFSNPSVLELGGKDALGIIHSGPALEQVGVDEELLGDLQKRYLERFGVEADSFSINAYDAAQILMKDIFALQESAEGFSAEALRAAVAATQNYQGVSKVINFDQQGDVIENQAIRTTVNGDNGIPKYQQVGVFKLDQDQLVQVK